MPPFVIGRVDPRNRPVELSPHINPEWTRRERGHSGDVSRPFIEIRGSVQMSVRRWVESVSRANEDHCAEGGVPDRSYAGSTDFRPGRFFPHTSPAACATFRVRKKQGIVPALIPVQYLVSAESFRSASRICAPGRETDRGPVALAGNQRA